MSLLGFAVLVSILTGEGESKADSAKLTVSMVAVEARQDESQGRDSKSKTFGKGIPAEEQAAFSKLPYNVFSLLKSDKSSVSYGNEARFRINSSYALSVKPIGKARNGTIQAEIRMEEHQEGGPARNAVISTSYLVPGDRLLLRVPQSETSEMVVSLCIRDS